MLKHGTAPFLGQMIPNLFTESFAKNNPECLAQLIDTATAYQKLGIIGATQAMIERADTSAVLEGLNVPIHLVIGQLDNAVPYINSLKMCSLGKVTSVQILENVAHMAMFEATETAQKGLFDFFDFCLKK